MRPGGVAATRLLQRRTLLLHTLPLVTICWPLTSSASRPALILPDTTPVPLPPPPDVDPLFSRLRNHYYLLRPGQTTFEAAGLVDSNPINKQNAERGLTAEGRAQVEASAEALDALGVLTPIIFYDNGARATQTADVLARRLLVPRAKCEPEFRWLEARGLGALDGGTLAHAAKSVRSLDALDIDNRPESSDDGTPSDSVNDIFSRMRNTIAKIENSYSGDDFVIIAGDASVLSVLAAAAAGADLREHARFELRPGEFWDLDELVRKYKSGEFSEREQMALSEEELARGRDALRDIGPKLFSDTEAGSWVLGPGVRR